MMTSVLKLTRLAVLPILLPFLGGCGGLRVAAGPAYDAGTLGVGGVEPGFGGAQLEVLAVSRDRSWSGGPVVELAGYQTDGDGDPIAFTTFEVRHRLELPGFRPGYVELGTGAGAAWSPGVHHAAVPVQVEVGAAGSGPVAFRVGVRERFIGLIGTGSPPVEAFNSLQLVLGLEVWRDR